MLISLFPSTPFPSYTALQHLSAPEPSLLHKLQARVLRSGAIRETRLLMAPPTLERWPSNWPVTCPPGTNPVAGMGMFMLIGRANSLPSHEPSTVPGRGSDWLLLESRAPLKSPPSPPLEKQNEALQKEMKPREHKALPRKSVEGG